MSMLYWLEVTPYSLLLVTYPTQLLAPRPLVLWWVQMETATVACAGGYPWVTGMVRSLWLVLGDYQGGGSGYVFSS